MNYFCAIFLAIYIVAVFCDPQLELTLTVWKGQNCEKVTSPPYNCKVDNLGNPAWSKVYTFSKNDTLCASIPGENPAMDDRTNTIWPHSATWTSDIGRFPWDVRIKEVCNGTHFNFHLFTDIKCPANVVQFDSNMPLDVLIPVQPQGWPTPYTEKFNCRILGERKLALTIVGALFIWLGFYLF